jgi:anti-sigma regulatory factor (Ser/Thr protein kinase)
MNAIAEARAEFPPESLAVRRARAFAVEAAGLEGEPGSVMALLVSEVASNAVLHAGTPFTVGVSRGPGQVRVEVEDGSPTLPVPKHYDIDAPTGRGLRILEALASRWGVVEAGDGKVVWFEFDLEESGAA